jgi:hypothetical protein
LACSALSVASWIAMSARSFATADSGMPEAPAFLIWP